MPATITVMQANTEGTAQQTIAGNNQATSQAGYYDDSAAYSWQATEFADHQRPASWYAAYIFVVVVIIGLAYWLLRDIITVVALAVVAVVFVFGITHKPRDLEYTIDEQGITVGRRHYLYESFKCFSMSHDATGLTISLQPTKRYLPALSLRCSAEHEDGVLEALTHYLPYKEKNTDFVDNLTHKFRF